MDTRTRAWIRTLRQMINASRVEAKLPEISEDSWRKLADLNDTLSSERGVD